MTHVLGLYIGVVFEREDKKWLPLAREFLSVQLVKVQNKHERVYRVWAYEDEKLKIEMRILASLKVSRKETFVRMIDEQFEETMGIRFKTKDMANQFFDDIRDVLRKAPVKELVDLPEDHEGRKGIPDDAVRLKVHLPSDEKGKERKCYVMLDRRTTMGQLLAAIRQSSKVNNPNAWIEIRPNRYKPLPPHFTVSSSVGNLGIREIWVVHNKGPPLPPAIKVVCHLPVGNKVVMEMSPHITIKEMFIFICNKYKLDKMMHSVVSRNNKTQLLDMSMTVVGSQVAEFVVIRQKYPIKAHEYWDDDPDCSNCDDCGFGGLPYSKEWNSQKLARPIPPDEVIRTPKKSVGDHDETQKGPRGFIREREPSDSDGDRKKSPMRDAIGRIKEHVRSLKKSKLYPNPGPLSGGERPGSADDFGKMREERNPPGRDTINDVNFEKAKSMYNQYRHPLSGTSRTEGNKLYPDVIPEPEPAVQPSQQNDTSQQPNQQCNQGMSGGYPGQMPYPPNPMYNGMYAPMMDPWGNRFPSPFYPYGMPQTPYGYMSPNARHPTPFGQSQPAETRPDPFQSCSVNTGSCGGNPADPLPRAGNPQKPQSVSSLGKYRAAPLPPMKVDDESKPSIRSSQNPDTSRIEQDMDKYIPVDQTSRREPFKNVKAPPPPNISTKTVRKFHGSGFAPPPAHFSDLEGAATKLANVKNSNTLRGYVKRIERKYRSKEGGIPEETAILPQISTSVQPLSQPEQLLLKAGILTDERKDRLPDRLSFKQKRNFVKKEANGLIDDLVGAIKSGDMLKSLKQEKQKSVQFDFKETGKNLVEHGDYLNRQN